MFLSLLFSMIPYILFSFCQWVLNWCFSENDSTVSIMTPRSPSWMARVYLDFFFPIFFALQISTLNLTCHFVIPSFVSFFSCFQCQLLLQLLSTIICQKALLFWSSHLFQMINACTEQQSYLKTTSVTSTRSLKLWWLLIPNLYFIIVSHLLNHNRNFFLRVYGEECYKQDFKNPLHNNDQIILILVFVVCFRNSDRHVDMTAL